MSRCLDPQTPPEVRPFGVEKNTDPHKVFGGFWKARVTNINGVFLGQWIFQVPVKGGRDYITP